MKGNISIVNGSIEGSYLAIPALSKYLKEPKTIGYRKV